jgi:hypothetical protein
VIGVQSFLTCAALSLLALSTHAESGEATWAFTKGVDYESPKGALAIPTSTALTLSVSVRPSHLESCRRGGKDGVHVT